jgi:hypothetical protein
MAQTVIVGQGEIYCTQALVMKFKKNIIFVQFGFSVSKVTDKSPVEY